MGINWDVAVRRLGVSAVFFKFWYLRREGVGEPDHPLSTQISVQVVICLTLGMGVTAMLCFWCFSGFVSECKLGEF